MGVRIEAVATATPHGRLFGRGALHLSDFAARECLHRAHHSADELDLLINVGIYKDYNTAEPALAAIIQEDIGANPGSPPSLGHHGTFSFDLANGGCGVITAAELIAGFVGSNTGPKLGMIVAGDSDPSPRTSRNFPFKPAGGAMLLGGGERGFARFLTRTFPHHASLFEAALKWDPRAGLLQRGRNLIEIKAAPELVEACLDSAESVARELVDGAEIDLLVTSQYPANFGSRLAHRLGVASDRVPRVAAELASTHTAGPLAALEAAIRSGQLTGARHVLFVTVGAGLTVAAAIYSD